HVFAAYEDIGYFLWREGKLPINVEPTDSRLDDRAERERLRRVFARGLGEPVGHALPVAADERRPGRFRSSPWYLRGDHCFLVAGDSPIGFRLPLESLPWARAEDLPWVHPPDPDDELPRSVDADAEARDTAAAPPALGESAGDVVRTAISAEARYGRLHVFMP